MRLLVTSVIIFIILGGSTLPETPHTQPMKSSKKWNPLSLLLMPMCSKKTVSICTPLRLMMRKKPSSQTGTLSPSDALKK